MSAFPAHLVEFIGRLVLLTALLLGVSDGALCIQKPLVPASNPAMPQADTWQALANHGLNNRVNALVTTGDTLYVGGSFTQTADGTVTNLNYIAKYDILNDTWHPLAHNGLNGVVNALAIIGNNLYIGGEFSQTADGVVQNMHYIARYNTYSGEWVPLVHAGLNGTVYALTTYEDELYLGGFFSGTFDGQVSDLNNIALYHNDNLLALANGGLNSIVYALDVNIITGTLYAGGAFVRSYDSAVTNLKHIAIYGSDAWHALANDGLNGTVYTIQLAWRDFFAVDVYAGGEFTKTADSALSNLNNIAIYQSGDWQTPDHLGLNNGVYALLTVDGDDPDYPDLYVGGVFTRSADNALTSLSFITKYKPTSDPWTTPPNNGLASGGVFALAQHQTGKLYVGGSFTQTRDGTVTNLNNIAVLTGKTNTKTTLTSSRNPSSAGQAVTFTALVDSMDPLTTPTGTVTFQTGSSDIPSCVGVALAAGQEAKCTTAALAVGTHTIRAAYNGDSYHNTSSGTLQQVVNIASPETKYYLPRVMR